MNKLSFLFMSFIILIGCSDENLGQKVSYENFKVSAYTYDSSLKNLQPNVELSNAKVYGLNVDEASFVSTNEGIEYRGNGEVSNSIFNLGSSDENGYLNITPIFYNIAGADKLNFFELNSLKFSTSELIRVLVLLEQGKKPKARGNMNLSNDLGATKIIEAQGSNGLDYEGFLVGVSYEVTDIDSYEVLCLNEAKIYFAPVEGRDKHKFLDTINIEDPSVVNGNLNEKHNGNYGQGKIIISNSSSAQ